MLHHAEGIVVCTAISGGGAKLNHGEGIDTSTQIMADWTLNHIDSVVCR